MAHYHSRNEMSLNTIASNTRSAIFEKRMATIGNNLQYRQSHYIIQQLNVKCEYYWWKNIEHCHTTITYNSWCPIWIPPIHAYHLLWRPASCLVLLKITCEWERELCENTRMFIPLQSETLRDRAPTQIYCNWYLFRSLKTTWRNDGTAAIAPIRAVFYNRKTNFSFSLFLSLSLSLPLSLSLSLWAC